MTDLTEIFKEADEKLELAQLLYPHEIVDVKKNYEQHILTIHIKSEQTVAQWRKKADLPVNMDGLRILVVNNNLNHPNEAVKPLFS